MPQEPKKRHSRQRQGKRRAAIHLTPRQLVKCSNCQALNLPHQICLVCGFYQGRQIIKNKTNEKSS